MFGFYNICKPPGPTSHDIVARMRKRLPRKTRVGHAGTLDPFAQGVVLLAVGPATRLIEYVHEYDKSYRTTLQLHAVSSTHDATGQIEPVPCSPKVARAHVLEAIEAFRGPIQQVPPAHSAAKVAGRRAYQLAREGKEVKLAPRRVEVRQIRLLEIDDDRIELDVTCSTGTYIRAIARDLGQRLGTGAYCRTLVRTRIGPFHLEQAAGVEEIDLQADCIDPLEALGQMRRIEVSPDRALALAQGKRIEMPPVSPDCAWPAALTRAGRLVALAEACEGGAEIRPIKVFVAPEDVAH
jgi:tRNA pseudouridine55 synthase